MDLFYRHTAGLGLSRIYARLRNVSFGYFNFISLLWDNSDSVNNRVYLIEYPDSPATSTSLYTAIVPVPANGPYLLEVVDSTGGAILYSVSVESDPVLSANSNALDNIFVTELTDKMIVLESTLLGKIAELEGLVDQGIASLGSSVVGLSELSNDMYGYVYGVKLLLGLDKVLTPSSAVDMSCYNDRNLYFSGGMSRAVRVTSGSAAGTKLSYVFASGKEVDLSQCNTMSFKVYATAIGGFIRVGLSEDGNSWHEFACNIGNDFAWVDWSADITAMASRTAIKYIDIKYVPSNEIIDGVELLATFPSWNVSDIGFWMDNIVCNVNASGVHGDWA